MKPGSRTPPPSIARVGVPMPMSEQVDTVVTFETRPVDPLPMSCVVTYEVVEGEIISETPEQIAARLAGLDL